MAPRPNIYVDVDVSVHTEYGRCEPEITKRAGLPCLEIGLVTIVFDTDGLKRLHSVIGAHLETLSSSDVASKREAA